MNPFRRIKELEKEVERLKPFELKVKKSAKAKKDLSKRRKELMRFFHYKNYYKTPRKFWPPILCIECVNCKQDGTKKEPKWKCSLMGDRVAKYSSCDQATKE